MFETILFILAAVAAAIFFFRVLEDWTDINDRIEDGTDPSETDEWPT